MNFVLRKKLLSFSSSRNSLSPARAFLVRLRLCEFSSSPHHWRRTEEDSRSVRVSVWWDFENCNVPAGVEAFKVGPAITEALRANGIKGPLQITAFGDVLQLSRTDQEALVCTGIRLNHIPNGGKNSADRYVDLMYWVSQNPPPVHLFLISGDRNFAGVLHRLRMINYNILLAVPGKTPDILRSAATIMWQWPLLLKGEDLIGKHFNHPPDGSFGSWYGNSKVPLENPFSAVELSTSLQIAEISEPSLDFKLGAVPKSVVRQVTHILSSHPKGISIPDLRVELAKCDVHLDKNFYGYSTFFRFLLSIPRVQVHPLGKGQFCVRLIPSEFPKSFESNVVSSTASAVDNEERGSTATTKLNGVDKRMAGDVDDIPSIASLHERIMDDDSKSFQPVHSQGKPVGTDVNAKSSIPSLVQRDVCQPLNELRKSSLGSKKIVNLANAKSSAIEQLPEDNKVSEFKTDSIKMRSESLSDNDIARPRSEDVSHEILDKNKTSRSQFAGNDHTVAENDGIANYESEKLEMKIKDENLTKKEVEKVCHRSNSSLVDDSLVGKRPGGSSETYSKSPTFFSWIRSWWPFWKTGAKSDDSSAPQNTVESQFKDPKLDQNVSHFEEPKLSELDQNVSHSGKPELFSSDSFWNDMESFVYTPKGSLLFNKSRSREDMAHKLLKDGPLALRSLSEKDILQLVDLLIADKKWLAESPSRAFPFRLTQPFRKSSLMGQSLGANGLRSLFLNKTPQSNKQNSHEHKVEKHDQSIPPHTRVSMLARETKSSERTRNDILRDCQKLLSEILRKHPEGYNIGCFRKLFVSRYGYHLDLQKLGYQKLATFLQIMPGVKIESTFIFPSDHAECFSDVETCNLKTQVTNASHAVSDSDSELSDSVSKDDNIESTWEESELGPVSVNNSNHSELESTLSRKAKELDTPKYPDYEPIDSDFDPSESEGDSSCLTQPKERRKPKCNEQDSSFWESMDLWHNSKEGENRIKKSDNISVAEILDSSGESTRGTLSDKPARNYREKPRSRKNYSFVADPDIVKKDKLIDGILDGFKKSDESKMQN